MSNLKIGKMSINFNNLFKIGEIKIMHILKKCVTTILLFESGRSEFVWINLILSLNMLAYKFLLTKIVSL
jgi:hypothetical protein